MRNTRVWERACGLDAHGGRGRRLRRRRAGGGGVGATQREGPRPVRALLLGGRLATTTARAGGGGGRWISGRRRCSSRPTHPGSGAERTGRRSPRSRGPATAPGTPATSTTWRPGWRSAPRRPRCASCCGWRGARSGRSSPGSTPTSTLDVDRLDGLRRIGIDEISYKRGHRYLIVVVDHDTGALVWAGPGRNDAALHVFFDQLGPERAAPAHPRQR